MRSPHAFVRALAAIAIVSLLPHSVMAKTSPAPRTLRVLTYNVKGLPVLINPHFHTNRFAEIGRRLAARRAAGTAPDIVVFQEAFSDYAQDIADQAGYPYVLHGAGTSGTDSTGSFSKTFGSGLLVLSRFPLRETHTLSFNHEQCGTWDCYANKGAVETEVLIPSWPEPLILATTHLQSAAPYDTQRIDQMLELDQFIRPFYPIPGALIFAGDFNTCPDRPSYDWWKKASGLLNARETCAAAGRGCTVIATPDFTSLYGATPDFSVKHDQVYYTDGTHVALQVMSIERNFGEPFDGKQLSDHLGYETVFRVITR